MHVITALYLRSKAVCHSLACSTLGIIITPKPSVFILFIVIHREERHFRLQFLLGWEAAVRGSICVLRRAEFH